MLAILIAVDASPQMLLEFASGDTDRLSLLFGLLTLYLQLVATFRALDQLGVLPSDHDRRRPTEGRYLAALVLSAVTTIGMAAGFVLLIIPGLWLAGRWGMAMAILAAERRGPIESLSRSWRLAGSHQGTMVRLVLVLLGVVAIVIASSSAALSTGDALAAPIAAITDLGLSIIWILSSTMWAVAYADSRSEEEA